MNKASLLQQHDLHKSKGETKALKNQGRKIAYADPDNVDLVTFRKHFSI